MFLLSNGVSKHIWILALHLLGHSVEQHDDADKFKFKKTRYSNSIKQFHTCTQV